MANILEIVKTDDIMLARFMNAIAMVVDKAKPPDPKVFFIPVVTLQNDINVRIGRVMEDVAESMGHELIIESDPVLGVTMYNMQCGREWIKLTHAALSRLHLVESFHKYGKRWNVFVPKED